MKLKQRLRHLSLFLLGLSLAMQSLATAVSAEIAASHVYHNHMPNFWAYYDVSQYNSTPIGSPIRYTYDGQVINLKNNPPSNYTYYLPNGSPMPHDDLVSYYSHHAKTGAYLSWPWSVAGSLNNNHPEAQMHVTMSGALINNVNSLVQTGTVAGYSNPNWGTPWKSAYDTLRTPNAKRTLDAIHFAGHHTMGPLVGNDYLLKDLIYQAATLAQPYFLGSSYTSSKGFFPTELGFSERIIPVLEKLGIQWSVIGNNHFSRTLQDYPLLNNPGADTLVSPPNRADLQNVSNVGSWISQPMFNEQQVTHNKFPFASTPHWVQYVNPDTGAASKVVGIPVAQAESWEEGYLGQVKASALKPFEGLVPQKQFFVIAHDGDNSSGRAGSEETWRNAGNVTYTDSGVKGQGIDEYLRTNLPAASDIVHVQDGSWIDTRDSSSDPTWYHWRLPFGIWKSQFSAFNAANQTQLAPKKNLSGVDDGMTVSFEKGYHYLERNFALLQAALNYAKTAEQIWLEENPNYWQPTTALDNQITHSGNQLNPWMLSYPVKGNPLTNYAGGANPAELAWYFLMPAMDSGFGYYDENVDDNVKPTLSFNQSLYFSKPYVQQKLVKDKTGPSVWWPQRYPYNPGSANVSKAEGWTLHHFDNSFAIYSYAHDVSGIASMKVKVRVHNAKQAAATDNTFKVYDPAALQAQGVPNIDASKVGEWTEYDMNMRDLTPDINGVAWQPSGKAVMDKVPAQEIGNLYYTYLSDYRDQLLDYYIESTDTLGNITRSDIQQVYVGAGKYNLVNGKYVEDVNGTVNGTHPFITDQPIIPDDEAPSAPSAVSAQVVNASAVQVSWTAATDNVGVTGYEVYRGNTLVGTTASTSYTDNGLAGSTSYSYTVKAYDAAGNRSELSDPPATVTTPAGNNVTIYYKKGFTTPYIHYRPVGGTWTTAPGVAMPAAEVSGYNKITINIGAATQLEACFNNGSGQWDSNNSQNYLFGAGTWTYTPTGSIVAGAPVVIPPDTEAPTVPQNVSATVSSASAAVVAWSAATDNVGVTGYEIFRDGALVGTTGAAATSFTNTGLAGSTAYSYTVKAFDAAGNRSAASSPASVTTPAGNSLTIYYKNSAFANSYIHYKVGTATTWTTLPGEALQTAADYPGYKSITLQLGSATGITAAFNNGSGQWDNNGGNNYSIGSGTWTLVNGNLASGVPQADSVTFRVSVPASTPTSGPVYLTGSFNSWAPADAAYQMTKGTDGVYTLTLPLSAGSAIQYKVTRGTWATVEANANGSDIANRALTPSGGAQTVSLTVQRWKDQ
jgi:chitodextrinase